MKYLKQFVVGSCCIVTFPFMFGFNRLKNKNGNYVTYSYLVALYFGLANMLSLVLADIFNLTINQRFLLITILSLIVTTFFAEKLKIYHTLYDFKKHEWIKYYLLLIVSYTIVFNIIIKNIELNI